MTMRLFKHCCQKFPKPFRFSDRFSSSASNRLTVGQIVHGYMVEKLGHSKDFSMDVINLRHTRTGAKHLHLARKDRNCAFGICLPTIPENDKGTPHILEHLVLCGSKQYQCRDPFFKMVTRSVATFLNAMTFPQFTLYPFASENEKDYYNLLSVYYDAVFHPNLKSLDFLQEAWRIERNENREHCFKGVVFNEMKGVMSDPMQTFERRVHQLMLGQSDSGGDPAKIPDLTLDELRQFHQQNYNVSNARFLSYGSLDLSKCLSKLDTMLCGESPGKTHSIDWPEVRSDQSGFSANTELVVECMNDQVVIDQRRPLSFSQSYHIGSSADLWGSFLMGMVSSLLLNNESSELYQRLIDKGLVSSFAPGAGYSNDSRDACFHIALQGIKPEEMDSVQKTLQSTLEHIAEKGFDNEEVEGCLHCVELSAKHQTASFGIKACMSSAPYLLYGSDMDEVFDVSSRINRFRMELDRNPDLLKDIIKQRILNNPSVRRVILKPIDDFNVKMINAEKCKLEDKLKSLDCSHLKALDDDADALRRHQATIDDVSCLPKLDLEDITTKDNDYELQIRRDFKNPMLVFPHQTNGLLYLRHIFSSNNLPEHLDIFLPLYCNSLTRIGTKQHKYAELSKKIDLISGGISVCPSANVRMGEPEKFEKAVMMSTYCLERNLSSLMSLWKMIWSDFGDMLNNADSRGRLQVLLTDCLNDEVNSLTYSGNRYALCRARSRHSLATKASLLDERLSGLTQLDHMKQLVNDSNDGINEIVKAFTTIHDHLTGSECQHRTSVHCKPDAIKKAAETVNSLWIETIGDSRSRDHSPRWQSGLLPLADHSGSSDLDHYDLQSSEVNYCATAIKCGEHQTVFTDTDRAGLILGSSILTSKYLLPEVREKNGAYGASSSFDSHGFFSMTSYRDPGSHNTLKSFEACLQKILEGKFTDEDVLNAKLKSLQSIDKPLSPCDIGMAYLTRGITVSDLNQMRMNLLSMTRNQIGDVMVRMLRNKYKSSCIIGPRL